jgi:hypothetical protein
MTGAFRIGWRDEQLREPHVDNIVPPRHCLIVQALKAKVRLG